jgi:glycosyltransferase involved in cell wall biosynthesis
MAAMKFSIITPSRNNSDWLKLCVASVADQNVELEHLIQDGGSTDNTLNWILDDPRVDAVSAPDRSMYEAINRGFARATGDLIAYINCDEQYLPGALANVQRFFDAHPDVEILFGDAVVVEADGSFICYRKTVTPQLLHTWVHGNLSIFTCATFFRRSLIEKGLTFNPNVRMVGDTEWLLRVIASGAKMALLRDYTSAFTMTGRNIGFTETARREHEQFYGSAPTWARLLRHPIILHHWTRRFLQGAYRQSPFDYSIYTRGNLETRTRFPVAHPTFRWRGAKYVPDRPETSPSNGNSSRSSAASPAVAQ